MILYQKKKKINKIGRYKMHKNIVKIYFKSIFQNVLIKHLFLNE